MSTNQRRVEMGQSTVAGEVVVLFYGVGGEVVDVRRYGVGDVWKIGAHSVQWVMWGPAGMAEASDEPVAASEVGKVGEGVGE